LKKEDFQNPDHGAPPDLAHQPHDTFFKDVFSQPEQARAFFQSHLPASIAAQIDWSSLAVRPGSFVKSNLQKLHSDLLFSVQIQGREALLYLLFEHQSTVDPAMPLRLLGYLAEIFTAHHEQHGLPLPPVLPFVLHQGPETWTVSTHFEDLFELPQDMAVALAPYLPKFQHALLDLTQFDPATEEHDIQLRSVLQLMKLARQRDLLRYFQWFVSNIAYSLLNHELALKLLNYALATDSQLDLEKIYLTLTTDNKLKNDMMSIADRLKAEGKAQGKAEGRYEGQAEGALIGRIQSFEEFLDRPISTHEQLSALNTTELEERYQELHREYEVKFKRS
jgi:predicted transposase/invertase (TIGR01784 family)